MSSPLDSSASCTAVRPFRFLDLPAELRNRVYEYAVQNGPVARASGKTVTVEYLIHSPSTTKVHDTWFQAQQGRPYLGLTQVNRQIRIEFSPQRYHSSYKPAVPFDSQYEHLLAFPFRTEHLPPNYTVALRNLRDNARVRFGRGVNILPILEVHARALSPFVKATSYTPIVRMTSNFCCHAGYFQSQGIFDSVSVINIIGRMDMVEVTVQLRRGLDSDKLQELTTFMHSTMVNYSWSEPEIDTQGNMFSFWCDPLHNNDGAYDDDGAYGEEDHGTEELEQQALQEPFTMAKGSH